MRCTVEILIVLTGLHLVHALVHYQRLEATDKGCKHEKGEIAVGETLKDEKVCGVFGCQNTKGDALIYYCQKPATFAECLPEDTGVSTVLEFPQCCWTCVKWKDCNKEKIKRL